ncbi:MAG: alpha/beta fold hydrolase [Rhizomicrobium sp.]
MASALEALRAHFIVTPSGARLRTAVFERSENTQPRGVCVLLHGQTEFIEKYAEVIDELRGRGFGVATFDWRGQGGSTRALPDPLKCHVGNFREYDEDLATFLEQVIKPMGVAPPLVLAHSMGAHILLRTLHDRPRAFSAAVLSAPMMAVSTRGQPAFFAAAATFVMNAVGQSTDWVMGMADRDPLKLRFEDNLVTSDRRRWAQMQALVTKRPELRLAGPTWGWLKAANESMARVLAPGYAEAIGTPVLVCGAGKDRICKTEAARDFAKRLPRGTYVALDDAEHEILMENDSIRARFWGAFDEFANANQL